MGTSSLERRIKALDTKISAVKALPLWCMSLSNDTLIPLINHMKWGGVFQESNMDKKTLMKIRGIGEKRAEEILMVYKRWCESGRKQQTEGRTV